MALNTTQALFRSGGGDNSRTAYCGSMLMVAQFYVANAGVTTAANVLNAANGQALVLPAGAVVTAVSVTTAGTGHVNLGNTPYSGGANVPASIATNLDVSAKGTTPIGTVVSGTPLSTMSYVTAVKNTDGAGVTSGVIQYYVADPLAGQENV